MTAIARHGAGVAGRGMALAYDVVPRASVVMVSSWAGTGPLHIGPTAGSPATPADRAEPAASPPVSASRLRCPIPLAADPRVGPRSLISARDHRDCADDCCPAWVRRPIHGAARAPPGAATGRGSGRRARGRQRGFGPAVPNAVAPAVARLAAAR